MFLLNKKWGLAVLGLQTVSVLQKNQVFLSTKSLRDLIPKIIWENNFRNLPRFLFQFPY